MDGLRSISNFMNPFHSSKQIIVMEKLIYNPHQMAVCVLNSMTWVTKPLCKQVFISMKKMGDQERRKTGTQCLE